MNFCSHCGHNVTLAIPKNDQRERYICTQCGIIHYQNPRIITGCLATYEDKVLLCRRAIEPQKGLWTLPGGFMENGETSAQGAKRETLEEANAQVEIDDLYGVFDVPHINQVYMIYRGKLLSPDFSPGEESLEVKLFPQQDIPWCHLAFSIIPVLLKRYYKDQIKNHFPLICDVAEQQSLNTSAVSYHPHHHIESPAPLTKRTN